MYFSDTIRDQIAVLTVRLGMLASIFFCSADGAVIAITRGDGASVTVAPMQIRVKQTVYVVCVAALRVDDTACYGPSQLRLLEKRAMFRFLVINPSRLAVEVFFPSSVISNFPSSIHQRNAEHVTS